jgi:hypothetical protein
MAGETLDGFGVSEARIEAATLLRRLGHAFIGHHIDDERLQALSAAVGPFVEELEADPLRFRAQQGREDPVVADATGLFVAIPIGRFFEATGQ